MPDKRKPLDLSGANQILSSKRPALDLSGAQDILKKKVDSKPRSQEELWGSDSQPQDLYTSLVTGAQEPQQESDGLGGPPSPPVKKKPSVLFPETSMGRPAASVMYEAKQPTLVESTPFEEKPKKYYRIVSDEKKAVEQQISDLEQRNARLGRTPESLTTEGTYQALQKQKTQLDQEFEPAQTAIKQIQRQAAETNQPFERLVYGATDGKYSYFTTDIINLNKDVEDKLIDRFDSAPEETKAKWYKGGLPVEAKEEIINSAKNEVLTDNYNVLKKDADNYIKNIKDNPSIPLEEKLKFQKDFKERQDGFNSQIALDYSGKLLKNNFKITDANNGMDEGILSKYKGFIPDTVDVLSTFVEGMGQTAAKVLTGIPSLALIGAEKFNQLTGISRPEDYTAIEATEDWINDTTNLNFLPSSQTERGNIVVDGEFNPSYYSVGKTLAKTLPFTLKIMSEVKKGRIDGTPQSIISQLINPKYSKDLADKLRVVETAYKGTIADNYRDAKKMGMDDSKSFLYANTMALAEGVSENIMPDFKYFDSLTGASLKAAFKGGLKQAVTKQAVKNVTKDFFKSIALETGEEEVILATEDALKYSLLLNHKNSEFFNLSRQKELVATTAILSGALGGSSINQKFKQNKKDLYNSIHNNIYELQNSFLDEIDSPLNDQKAKEALITAYKFANDVSAAVSNAPENVTADQIDLLVQKKNLEEKKKNIDTAFHPDINEEIAGIDAKIRELAKMPAAVEEVVPAVEEVVPAVEEVKPVEVDNRPISERQAEAESKIKRKDLFTGVGDFSTELGGSDASAVPVSHREVNGIELVEYAHPKTGSVDVIVTGKSDNDFVGFYRIYENGEPTNKWSSKFENQSRNKEDFKTMISGVQSLLPEGHEYTEKTSISTDGLRVWGQQLERGYELQTDENGNIVTNEVAINGDAIVNELGIDVNQGNFDNISVTNNEQFQSVKKSLLPYLQKFGLNESNIRNVNGTVEIDLPVLKKSTKKAAAVEEVKPAEVKPSGQKVTDIINRPATLESQAGVKLETPIEGDVYQEGQRVIFEDKNKKTYDLGNIDEVSDKTVEELGIKPQDEMVSLTPEGKIKVGGNEWNMQSELPNYGIEYDNDGNVKAVSLKDDAGKTVMYEGQVAEDAAYQVLLKQTETPEQRQAINEILENDEELNRQLREAEEATQAAAAEVTEPGAPKTQAEQYSEELDKTKESDPEAYWSVSPVSAADAAKGTIIDTPDGAAIVKPDGDIAGLFKKITSKAKGVAQDLLKRAIAAGGKKLDNYDTYLTPQYIKAGFRVVSRTPFNEKYAPPGWNKEKHGTPDVVAMIYDPENKLDIEEKMFDNPDTGYDEAIAYRDSLLEPSIEAELEGLTKLFDESDKGFRMSQVDRAKEALKGILPGVEFIVHETNEAYKNAVGDSSSGTYIMYANGDKIIHINKKNANGRTVAHEVFHAVILDKIKNIKSVQEITARMVDAVYKTASPELRAKLDAFAAMYSDKTIRDEERLAELIGIIADGYPQMSPANKNIVKRWLDALAKTFGLKPFTDNEVIDLLNTLARKVSTGEVISAKDVDMFNEEGAGGFAGVFKISRQQKGIEAPKSKDDPRSFIRDLVEDVDIREFNGKKFITNMYDYTNAGETDLGNGFKINLFGGKGYVPYMMELNNKKIGDVSNLAAFNTQAQAETFIRNAEKSGAELFAPHSGTKDQSWQFQQHTFAELVDVVLDKGILTNKELIDTFNNSIKGSKALKETFSKFSERYGKKIKDFSSFKSDPKKIVDLLDIKNNLSPDLRKALNNSIASNKKFQEVIGIKNKEQFYNRIMDPLNNGVTGGEIMGVVKFDPNTFKIVETKPDAIDHHPSFGYTLLAKINGIYQPTEFYKSYDVTDSYTKYNTNETKVSIKSEDIKFNEKNVTSSAGAIPKVAEFKIKRSQLQEEGVTIEAKNNTLYTVNDNGKTVGSMELTSNKVLGKGYLSVNLSKLNEKYIGKGIGLDLYRTVANKLKDKGIVLTSSVFRNDKSDRVWKSLEKSGEAVKIYSDIRLKDSVYALVNPEVRRSQKVEWEESKLGKGDKAITDRQPVLQNAAERYANKEIGYEEYLKIKDVTSPIKPITDFIEPAKEEDIKIAVGKNSEGKTNLKFDKGTLLGLRLDIPAYINKNIWAITIHAPGKGKVLSYNNVARIKNVTFGSNAKDALNIARKKISKATIARMEGEWIPIDGNTSEEKGKSAMKFVESILNNPEWSQVGMNPFRHSWFYDRADGKPVLAADELIQIGGLVYAKNVVKTTPYDKSFEFIDQEGDLMRFQQANNIDEIVRIAKEAKYSDAAISSFLKAKGFNVDEITKAILGYDKKIIETRQKEEGIFTREGRNKLATSLDSFRRRFLSARSFLGRSTFIAKEGIEAGIKAQSKIASYLVSDLDNAIKKYDGDKEKVIADFDKFIRGEKVDLPDNFLEIGNAMRDHIDKLSYELINSGSVDEYQAENIKKNIGSYLNRSYEVFDKKDWAKNVDEVTLQAAKNFLKKQLLSEVTKEAKARGLDVDTLLETKANQAIENLLNKESAQSFVSSGKTGSKDISILKQKTDIPLEIRALMGEYTDPAQNYSRTIFKVASLISNAKYLNTVKNNGINVYLFKEKTGEFNTQIAGKESETMNPLNGLYTTKELAGSLGESAGILNAIDVALPYEISGTVRSTYEYYMKLLGSVKWLKTIASVGTHFKNVSGNVTFMLANGYFKPDAYRQSAKVIYNDFLKKTDQELRDKMQEYVEAGIIDQSAVLGELRSMFKEEDFDKTFERRMNSEKLNSTNKFVDRVKRFGKKSAEFAQNAYQAEDDYFKIVSYETEKNRYANAMFRNDYSKLSEDEQSDVRDHVREITKNVLPNYGRVPGAVKLVKAFPVVGTFISFQTEALRTAYNIVNLSVTELKSSNPEIKKIGALRMSGIIASQAIKYGVMYLIGGSMLGDDDDEKKEKAKRFVAPWSKNSNVLVKDDGDGKFSYIDFSASDPFGGIVKPINAAMRGEDLLDGFIQGTKELVSPFTNPDILKSMFTEISDNKDSYGNQLYNPSDTFEVKSSAILSRVYKTFEPGTLTSVRKISKSDSPLNEMTGQFTGYKANDVDLAKQFSFKISDMKKMEVETRNIYNRAFRKFENKEITEAELQAAYSQSNKATIDTYKELKKDYDAAIYFGTDYKDLKDEMKRSKVSKDVIKGITTGDFKDLKKKEGIETDAQLKARNPKVYEKIMRFRERRKNAQ